MPTGLREAGVTSLATRATASRLFSPGTNRRVGASAIRQHARDVARLMRAGSSARNVVDGTAILHAGALIATTALKHYGAQRSGYYSQRHRR